jgi:DNA-binding MarR family transcriptional regulator
VDRSDSLATKLIALGDLLRRVYLGAIEAHGVSALHVALLSTLKDSGPMKMADLTEAMHLSKGNLTYHVDRLEELGWVRRETSPGDRRITLLSVCPDGLATLDKVHGAIESRLERMVEQVPPTEVILMKAGLDLLIARENLLVGPEKPLDA